MNEDSFFFEANNVVRSELKILFFCEENNVVRSELGVRQGSPPVLGLAEVTRLLWPTSLPPSTPSPGLYPITWPPPLTLPQSPGLHLITWSPSIFLIRKNRSPCIHLSQSIPLAFIHQRSLHKSTCLYPSTCPPYIATSHPPSLHT